MLQTIFLIDQYLKVHRKYKFNDNVEYIYLMALFIYSYYTNYNCFQSW